MGKLLEGILAWGMAISAVLMVASFLQWTMLAAPGVCPQTPTVTVHDIVQTSNGKIIIAIEAASKDVQYQECGVIILPPGDNGGFGRSKLWDVREFPSGFIYNETMTLAIDPMDPHEYIGPHGPSGVPNDAVVIDCSVLGMVPSGSWMFFLLFSGTTYPMLGLAWSTYGPVLENHSLDFTDLWHTHPDPMGEFGYIDRHPERAYEQVYILSMMAFTIQGVALARLKSRIRHSWP